MHNGKILSTSQLCHIFNKYKDTKYGDWLKKYPIKYLNCVFRDLDKAFTKFFKSFNENRHDLFNKKWLKYCKNNNLDQIYALKDHPKFKSKKKSKISFCCGDVGVYFKYDKNDNLIGAMFQKSNKDPIKIKCSKKYSAMLPKGSGRSQFKYIHNARVVYDHKKWILVIALECDNQTQIKNLMVISYDNQIMKFKNINKSNKIKKLEKRLNHIKRRIGKKIRDNKNNWDSKGVKDDLIKMNKIYYKLHNIRIEYIRTICNKIIKLMPKSIVFETLNIQNIMKIDIYQNQYKMQCGIL